MSALKRLSDTFKDCALGVKSALTASAAALATVATLGGAMAPTTADAQVTEADVDAAFGLLTDYANRNRNMTILDGDEANALYTILDRSILDYPSQSYTQSKHALRDDAIFLAERYGLTNSQEFGNLNEFLNLHSGIAHLFQIGTGQSLAAQENHLFNGGKYQAVVNVQKFAAEFLELAAEQYQNDSRITQDEYAAFGRFCYLIKEQGNDIQRLYESVETEHGRPIRDRQMMTAENPDGSRITCPAPRR